MFKSELLQGDLQRNQLPLVSLIPITVLGSFSFGLINIKTNNRVLKRTWTGVPRQPDKSRSNNAGIRHGTLAVDL